MIVSHHEIERQVFDFMAESGIPPAGSQNLIIDGKLHRYQVDGDKTGSENGFYRIYPDGLPAGYVGSWKHTGEPEKWKYNASALGADVKERLLGLEQTDEYKRLQEERKKQLQEEQAKASNEAQRLFSEQATEAQEDHPYLQRKNVAC